MNDKKMIRLDELQTSDPLRQSPFSAPDGYFDDLPMQIQARIQATKPAPVFTMSWSWQRSVVSLVGATLVAVLVWVTLPERQETLGQEMLSSVSNEAIASYLEDQGVDANELMGQSQLQPAITSDSTMFKYMNVRPEDIQQHVEDHPGIINETLNLGS